MRRILPEADQRGIIVKIKYRQCQFIGSLRTKVDSPEADGAEPIS